MSDKKSGRGKKTAREHSLRTLINHLEDPMWLVGTDYLITECNTAFCKWVSYFINEELREGDHVLYNGKDAMYQAKFEMCYRLALSGKSFKTVEDMVVGGETRYTSVSFTPVFDGDAVAGVSCYARDITEQRKHLLKIEEQNTALREIAFIESHKVRGPVATILGLGQLFNHEDLTDPVNQVVVEGITKLTKELDLIIREVVLRSNAIER